MSKLRDVATAPGPFASVYFDASHDTEDAVKVAELRWRGLRDDLADQGADEKTLAALDRAVTAARPPAGKAGRALVASGGTVLVNQELPIPPPADTARFSPMPDLLPLAAYLPPPIPHVVVVADRSGADLHAFDGRVELKETVEGKQHPLHKTPSGGWAHKRIQQRVEDTVKHNVQQIAREVERLVDEVHAELVVLGGEVQARTAVRNELTVPEDLVVEVEGTGLAEGTDDEAFATAVRSLIAQRQQQHDAEVVERYRAELGQEGLAVEGLDRVMDALHQANVDTLIVNVDELRQVNVDSTLTREAVMTGANVVVGDDVVLLEGVGAILRHQ